MIGAVILAAGASRRYGRIKQLVKLRGRPLIEYPIIAAEQAASLDRVVVVLGSGAEEIEATADLGSAEALRCPNWPEGISASIRCGLEALGRAKVVVLLLGDQPDVSGELIEFLLGQLSDDDIAVRATYKGRPGHPVVVRSELFPALAALTGDRGGLEVLKRAGVREIECSQFSSGRDIDRPSDLPANYGHAQVEGDTIGP